MRFMARRNRNKSYFMGLVGAGLLLLGLLYVGTFFLNKTAPAGAPAPQEFYQQGKVRPIVNDEAVEEQLLLPTPSPAATASPALAAGGTTPPNDQPFDLMFFESAGVNPFVD